MNELLKDVLNERAEAAERPHLDLEAIVATGDKRIRRHRITGAVASTAAVVTIAVTAATVIDTDQVSQPDGIRPAQPAGAFEQRTTTYSTGSVIHYGDQQIDVAPHSLASFVQTDDGFVFTDSDGTVFTADGSSVEKIGATDQPYGTMLAAGDDGSYVTWMDTDASAFKVYDMTARREVASVPQPPQPPHAGEFDLLAVLALDGSTAYWHTADGVVSYDIEAGQSTVVKPGASTLWLADVADGVLARRAFLPGLGITVSADPDAKGPTVPGYNHATLSPDAGYVATDPQDSEQVFVAANGREVTPVAEGYSFTAVVQWIDNDSYVALGIPRGNSEDEPFDLLICSISAGSCSPDRESVGIPGKVQFPVGEDLRDS